MTSSGVRALASPVLAVDLVRTPLAAVHECMCRVAAQEYDQNGFHDVLPSSLERWM